MNSSLVGRWAFIVGIVLALLAGFTEIPSLGVILFILGLIVGLLNIKEEESTSFLVSVIALLIIGVAGSQLGTLTETFESILTNFIAFVSAAGLIVSIKQILAVTKPSL